jgi:hypothetical protein
VTLQHCNDTIEYFQEQQLFADPVPWQHDTFGMCSELAGSRDAFFSICHCADAIEPSQQFQLPSPAGTISGAARIAAADAMSQYGIATIDRSLHGLQRAAI